MDSCPSCGTRLPEQTWRCPACGADVRHAYREGEPGSVRERPDGEQRLVTVRTFNGPRAFMEADMAKNFLEAEGIPCMLPGEGAASVLPGVDVLNLFVREEDAEQAVEILKSLLDTPSDDAGD